MEKDPRNKSLKDKTDKPCSILVVEDDEGLSRLIAKSLKKRGFGVEVVNNGAQAVDCVVNNPIELILLDYRLPDMSAKEMIEVLRERQLDTPFIIMTGHGDERLAVEMMKCGSIDYIVKDAQFFDLFSPVVERALEELQNEKKLAQANKALEESEKKYRTIVDSALVGVYKTGINGNVIYANKALLKMFGYESEEEMTLNNMLQVYQDNSDRGIFIDTLKRLGSIDELESTGITKEGEVIHVLLSATLEVDTFSGMIVDISKHVKMEETLLQSEKLRSIGTITLGIAHEFNNILAIISGNVYLLEERYKEDKELMDALHTIKTATDDGVGISSKMFKFTRTQKKTTEYAAYDLTDLIKQAVDFTMPRWKNMAQANNINYQVDTEGTKEVFSILCNPTEIREVFVNIIHNALEAMPDGGRISFNTRSKDDLVLVNVSDTGKGMTEDVKKNIFDPFFTTRRPEGTGLGMSTSFGIIKMHGGDIKVNSEVGKGSTFTLQFPITRKTVSPEISSEPIEEQDKKCNEIRVLVVDDDEAICKLLDKFLSGKGLKVKTTVDGAKAIEMASEEKFDLVLCDMAMPHVYGYDVIKALNKLEERPKIGIITGWGEKLKSIDADDLKVDFIAKKPFNFNELLILINRAFSRG
jgi:PAS domain S-box-containing protein